MRLLQAKSKGSQDPGYGAIQGAGDEAEAQAQSTPLQVDTISVQIDRKRVAEIIADIDKQKTNIELEEKENPDIESKLGILATNTATRAKLSVFDDKLDVSSVDTTAFAVQYRIAFADYRRLAAEATEYLSLMGIHSNDAFDILTTGFAKTPGLKIGEGQVGLERCRAARKDMNTAGKKMDAKLTLARGAANQLQGAIYHAQSAAAAANGADAATKLAGVRKEIDDVAGNVARVVKIVSAVAGLAGGVRPMRWRYPKRPGGALTLIPASAGLRQEVRPGPAEGLKLALLKAMGTDAASVFGDGGGPEKMAESLVKAIGEYANKGKISHLQQSIVQAAAEESSFKLAGDAQSMIGFQEQMDGAAKELSLLLQAFASARKEIAEASQALMEELNKGGEKGQGPSERRSFPHRCRSLSCSGGQLDLSR